MDIFRTLMGRALRGCARGLIVFGMVTGLTAAVAGPASPVTLDYFGLVMNRGDAAAPWPNLPFGSWRIWDAYVTWPYLEPERGRWDFAALDRMVDEAQRHHVNVLLVLAHSPAWASARPTEPSGYKPGFAAEPKSIDDWRDYVRTVATRYKGRISEYEVWNEPSDKTHFSGTVQDMAKLICEAHAVLKSIDPRIKVVSPGNAGGGRHIQYLDDLLAAGASKCVDVIGYHFYVPRFGPEAMVPLIRQVRDVMRKNGIESLPLWNTETGWWIANTDGSPDHPLVAKGGWRKLDADTEAGGVIERAFLLARSEGIERFYWYAWNNKYGWSLTDAAGQPKPAVNHWIRIANRMLGKRVIGCDTAAGPQFQCRLEDRDGAVSTVNWKDPTALARREGAAPEAVSPSAIPN